MQEISTSKTCNEDSPLPKVIHVIPYDGIGGVETAARSMANLETENVKFTVDYIYRTTKNRYQRLITFSPLPILTSVYKILTKKPDILVISLWRACIVGILVKWFRPQTKLILMLHLPNDVHWPDKILTKITAQYACQICADSRATLLNRLPSLSMGKGQVISFVTHHLDVLNMAPVRPNFIFWGRLHIQKRLERTLYLFAKIHASRPEAQFTIIGPDGGVLEQIRKLISTLEISDAVHFLGPMDMSGIKQQAKSASFYLQTSELEGMAMSVVEAMQLGLVPVVTPVGEIGSYCRNGENALFVYSNNKSIDSIFALLDDNEKYQMLRNNAIKTWQQQPLYAESLLQICKKLLLKH